MRDTFFQFSAGPPRSIPLLLHLWLYIIRLYGGTQALIFKSASRLLAVSYQQLPQPT